jgi:hypothetical protein
MGRFFRFLVCFQTSPMEICWSGADWFYTAQRRLNITLSWAGFTGFTGWRFNHLAARAAGWSTSNWMGMNNKEGMEGNLVQCGRIGSGD